VIGKGYFVLQAATLLKLAQTTTDPKVWAALVEKAAELARVRMDEVLFVANHAFDCIGAKSAGMRTAFVDRRRRPFGITPHQPDLVVASMRELGEAIA